MKNYIKTLAGAKLFYGIGEGELEAALRCLSPLKRDYGKGEYIFRSGEHLSSMGLVLCGGVHILKEDYWGNRAILAELGPGQLFGESYACAGQPELTVSAVSARDCSVLFLDVKRILSLCPSACAFHGRLIQNLVSILAEKNIYLTDKIEHMSQRRLRDKILSYLSDVSKQQGGADFTIPFSRQELADYLSVDRSALSGALCRLREEGVLVFHKNHFTFL